MTTYWHLCTTCCQLIGICAQIVANLLSFVHNLLPTYCHLFITCCQLIGICAQLVVNLLAFVHNLLPTYCHLCTTCCQLIGILFTYYNFVNFWQRLKSNTWRVPPHDVKKWLSNRFFYKIDSGWGHTFALWLPISSHHRWTGCGSIKG
jgi:hypothetical protein